MGHNLFSKPHFATPWPRVSVPSALARLFRARTGRGPAESGSAVPDLGQKDAFVRVLSERRPYFVDIEEEEFDATWAHTPPGHVPLCSATPLRAHAATSLRAHTATSLRVHAGTSLRYLPTRPGQARGCVARPSNRLRLRDSDTISEAEQRLGAQSRDAVVRCAPRSELRPLGSEAGMLPVPHGFLHVGREGDHAREVASKQALVTMEQRRGGVGPAGVRVDWDSEHHHGAQSDVDREKKVCEDRGEEGQQG
eukprot:913894-Rhodomonas_salina.1